MHNIFYELRKILSNRLTVYIFIIGFLINAFVIIKKPDTIRHYYNDKQAFDDMYERLSGAITQEDIDYVTENYIRLEQKSMSASFDQEYSEKYLTGYEYRDHTLFSEMYEKYRYIENYGNSIEKVRQISSENAAYYEKTGRQAPLRYNRHILETYSDRTISNFYETKNWKYYLNYSFSNLCILFVVIAALSGLFASERESRMSTLLLTSRYGKTKTFAGKAATGLLVTAGVTLLFIIEDFICFMATFQYKGLLEPIYSVEEMQFCIYDVSILTYLLIMAGMKLAGMLAIACVIMLASALAGSNLSAVVLSLLGILPMLVFNEKDVIFNAVRLLQISSDASRMNCIDFCGQSVVYLYYCLGTCAVLAAVCLLLGFAVETQYGRVFRRERV